MASFLNALGVAVYVVLVSLILRNGEILFGGMNNFLGPAAFLLLFVLSAAVTGALTIGRSVLWYLDGRKSEAVKLFLFTVGWLFLFTLILLLAQIKV